MKKLHYIKGQIAELNYWGHNEFIRKGSFHFLPNEEIFINTNQKNWEDLNFDNKISVVGRHKSGLIRHKKLHFKYLKNLRIEEIVNPSTKTIDFIKRVRISCFPKEGKGYQLAQLIVNHSQNSVREEITDKNITDKYYTTAITFVQNLQNAIRETDKKLISEKYMNEEVTIIPSFERHIKKVIQSIEIFNNYEYYFTQEVRNRILNTELASLFPTNKKLLVGNLEILINSNLEYKIDKIFHKKN